MTNEEAKKRLGETCSRCNKGKMCPELIRAHFVRIVGYEFDAILPELTVLKCKYCNNIVVDSESDEERIKREDREWELKMDY